MMIMMMTARPRDGAAAGVVFVVGELLFGKVGLEKLDLGVLGFKL